MKFSLALAVAAASFIAVNADGPSTTTMAATEDKKAAPVSVADAKLKSVGKAKEEEAIMKAVRDVESSLLDEAQTAQTEAEKECTDDQASEVKLAPFPFHGRSTNLVVGCEKGSKCANLMSTEQTELTNLATVVDSNKASASAKRTENANLSKLNAQDTKTADEVFAASKAATERNYAMKTNLEKAVGVLNQIRARLKENGKLVFTQAEAKVLGKEHVAFLQAAAKGVGSKAEVDALAKLIDDLIKKLRDEHKALGEAEAAQKLRSQGEVESLRANINSRQSKIAKNNEEIIKHDELVQTSTPLLAAKMTAASHVADGCVKGHKAYVDTMFSLRRELVVIREIKGYVAPAKPNTKQIGGSFSMTTKATTRKQLGQAKGSDLILSCLWKDQGWGNRKGKIEACSAAGQCARISTYASPHKWERFTFDVPANLGESVTFFGQAVAYSPGHKMYVKDCKVTGTPVE